MRAPWRGLLVRLQPALLLLPLLAACGEEGALTLRLVRAAFDDPYAKVDSFEVRVLDADLAQLERLTASAAGGDLELGLVASGERRVTVTGLDGAGRVVSRGHSRLLTLTSGEEAVEPIPFSSDGVAAALPAAAVIDGGGGAAVDGQLDDWRASPSLVLDRTHRVSGPDPSAADLRAELALAWDAGRLHLALRVGDDCPALRDGVAAGACGVPADGKTERVFLGLDGGGDGGSSFGDGDHWIELKAGRLWVHEGELEPAQIDVIIAPLPDGQGWVMEGSLKVEALERSRLDTKSKVGLEVMIVDQDPGQTAPTVLRWSGYAKSGPTPPSAMGSVGCATLPE